MTNPLIPIAGPGRHRLIHVDEAVALTDANVPGLAALLRRSSVSRSDALQIVAQDHQATSIAVLSFAADPWLLLCGTFEAKLLAGSTLQAGSQGAPEVHDLEPTDLVGLIVGQVPERSALQPIVADTWSFCGGFEIHRSDIESDDIGSEPGSTKRLRLGDPGWNPFADPGVDLNSLGRSEVAPLDATPCTLVLEGGEPIDVQHGAVIGRRPKEGTYPRFVAVTIASPRASRVHALIRVTGKRITIEDCDSGNGTMLRRGEVVLSVPNEPPAALWDGDVVEIGDEKIHVRIK